MRHCDPACAHDYFAIFCDFLNIFLNFWHFLDHISGLRVQIGPSGQHRTPIRVQMGPNHAGTNRAGAKGALRGYAEVLPQVAETPSGACNIPVVSESATSVYAVHSQEMRVRFRCRHASFLCAHNLGIGRRREFVAQTRRHLNEPTLSARVSGIS